MAGVFTVAANHEVFKSKATVRKGRARRAHAIHARGGFSAGGRAPWVLHAANVGCLGLPRSVGKHVAPQLGDRDVVVIDERAGRPAVVVEAVHRTEWLVVHVVEPQQPEDLLLHRHGRVPGGVVSVHENDDVGRLDAVVHLDDAAQVRHRLRRARAERVGHHLQVEAHVLRPQVAVDDRPLASASVGREDEVQRHRVGGERGYRDERREHCRAESCHL
eukprot:7379616-Prymnesium_polylepis.2